MGRLDGGEVGVNLKGLGVRLPEVNESAKIEAINSNRRIWIECRLGLRYFKGMKQLYFIAAACAVVLLAGCAAINRAEQKTLVQHNVSPAVCERMVQGDVLSLSDIIELSRKDVSARFIVHYLYSTRAIYSLDKQALARLNEAKVCTEVIDYLLETPSRFAPRYYPGPYYVAPAPWYPYDAYYPCGPRFYGSSTVIIENSRCRRR